MHFNSDLIKLMLFISMYKIDSCDYPLLAVCDSTTGSKI